MRVENVCGPTLAGLTLRQRTDSAADSKLFAQQMTQMARMDAVRPQVNPAATGIRRNLSQPAMSSANFARIQQKSDLARITLTFSKIQREKEQTKAFRSENSAV